MQAALLFLALMGSAQGDEWKKGMWADPGVFPIAVWLQEPSLAREYQKAGFNLYVGLWQGPTEQQLADLKKAGMPVICEQNAVGLAHIKDDTIAGWMHGDEPDNAQPLKDPVTGKDGYGPFVPPQRIVDEYLAMKKKDPTRPVMLNLGQGVANDEWIGRGNGSSLKDYETYVKGADLVSFDIYPIAGLPKPGPENYLWYVPKGIDRLMGWTDGKKPVWNCVECTAISGERKATPDQMRSEVWMAIIHGSRGLIYFVHQFKPQFDEHALLDDRVMLDAVTRLNKQIQELAPVIHSPHFEKGAAVTSAHEEVPISFVTKRFGGYAYLFGCAMRNARTHAKIAFSEMKGAKPVDVLGEHRTLIARDGKFEDDFGPYGVHIYKMASSN